MILFAFNPPVLAKEGAQFIEKKLIELEIDTEKTPEGLLVTFELKREWMINQATLSLKCPRGTRTITLNTKTSNSILIRNRLSQIEYFLIEACSLRVSLRGRSQEKELRNPYHVLIPID